MTQPNPFLAEVLDTSAAGFGSFAASLLMERQPELRAPGTQDLPNWRAHLNQKVLELSTALSLGRPELFRDRVRWSGQSFQARGLSLDYLKAELECLAAVLRDKLTTSVSDDVFAILDAGMAALDEPLGAEQGLNGNDPHQRLALSYLQQVLEGNSRQATRLVLDAAQEHPMEDIYLKVLMPAQAEVGRLWQAGELTIAEEHFVTATTDRVMAVLASSVNPQDRNGRTVVAAAVAGNAHQLGIRSVADFFDMAGWNAVHLGVDVPPEEIARAAQYFAADVVTLSVTMATQLKVLKQSITAVRTAAPSTRVIVGGIALSEVPDLWADTGADAYARHAADAVHVADSLLDAA